jgi:histidine triad (HIT) family protein
MADPDCLFCRIAAGEVPATVVYEDDQTISFMDINPSVRGHALVIPRAHSTDIRDIEPDDLAACMRSVQTVARKAIAGLDAEGANILQNTGRAAGQAVFHFHVHVLPRHRGDELRNPLSPHPGDPEDVAAAAEAIRGG